jgi:exopolysaccharide production protein ExoY
MANLVDTRGKYDFIAIAKPHPVGAGFKRSVDFVLALTAIILLAPLLAICFVATAVSSPGPVLFRHRRVGFNGKPFECLKFRTMLPDAAERLQRLLEADPAAAAEWQTSQKLRHDPRVTAIGALLRQSSLDELPQLFNVLRGEMSIVGPRPVTEDELQRYSGAVRAYIACRPGITGLWQVSGRSTTTYAQRVEYDAFYAQNWSVTLDARIIFSTIPALLSDGAY